jgi:hypothetical protein
VGMAGKPDPQLGSIALQDCFRTQTSIASEDPLKKDCSLEKVVKKLVRDEEIYRQYFLV